ncbi:hypothetical protein [Limosilactobacillus agrestis]|uniref:hypothetical protein n=1 Tax=Limosilactobacillus agrestis TaxID=2759748 RepID=UPI001E404A82|nr:hypothetical protein [Limosilactobacillus agrestis]MCD7112880.1 hypothetical protein [Limosilactobacillus agrestis]
MNLDGLDLHATNKVFTCVDLQTKWLIYVNNYFYGYLKYNSFTHHYAVTREWFPGQTNWPFDEPGVKMKGSIASAEDALALIKEQIQNKNITYNIENEDPVKISIAINGQQWGYLTAEDDNLWTLQYSAFPKIQIWATAPEDTGTTFVCFEGTKVPGTEFKSFKPIENFAGTWEEVKEQFEKQIKQNFDNEENSVTAPFNFTRN